MRRQQHKRPAGLWLCAVIALGALLVPTAASAGGGGVSLNGGGSGGGKTVPGKKAKLRHGKAIPPSKAPARVKRAIRAGNAIRNKPYRLGGGHSRWKDSAYDCSGAASYTLGKYGAKKLSRPMASGGFTSYGRSGGGKWITVYANGGHMYVKIAGLRFDTSNTGGNGPRWSKDLKGGKVNGPFRVRHPKGL